jgi:hypothetical protein
MGVYFGLDSDCELLLRFVGGAGSADGKQNFPEQVECRVYTQEFGRGVRVDGLCRDKSPNAPTSKVHLAIQSDNGGLLAN